jgi:hypothetical protein
MSEKRRTRENDGMKPVFILMNVLQIQRVTLENCSSRLMLIAMTHEDGVMVVLRLRSKPRFRRSMQKICLLTPD